MIIGLDISTSITGYCILDGEGEIIRADVWDTRNKNKFESFFEKAELIKEGLQEIKAQYPIQNVFIEKPFMFFGSGGSSAKTMASLQRFNGIVSWICYEVFAKKPVYFTAQQARKANNIKLIKKENTKKQILEWVLDKYPDFSIEYTHKGNPKPKYFDIADAIVIAKAGLK
jgi:Holliday junction resolvasome RuvABC endonuclease subunit|tara:strand:+ start:2822 stop:3334 length:513 start_codon:yes stop_codon:yes gene_type:complete